MVAPTQTDSIHFGQRTAAQRALLVIAGLFLFVLPMPHTVTLRQLALALAVILTVWLLRRPFLFRSIPLKWPIAIWIGAALLSVVWAVDPAYSLREIKNEILYTLLAFFVFYMQTQGRTEWHWWLGWVSAAAVVAALAAILAWRAGNPYDPGAHFYGGVGSYTTFVVTIFPFLVLPLVEPSYSRMARFLWGLLPLALFIGVYLTSNRIFWVALGGSSLVLFTLIARRESDRRRYKLALAAIVVLVGLAVVTFVNVVSQRVHVAGGVGEALERNAAIDTRPRLWSYALERVQERPWTGYGFGLRSFNYAYPEMTTVSAAYWHTHNIVLDYGFQMGIPGLVAFVVLFGGIVLALWRLYMDPDRRVMLLGVVGLAMVTSVLIKNMTDLFFTRENSLLFWSLLGMVLGYARYIRENNPPAPR